MKRNNERGFTLMELMVVIVIVAILAAVAVPLYINYVKDARRTEAKAAVGALATAMEEYYLRSGKYPTTIAELYTPATQGTLPSNLSKTTVDEIEINWNLSLTTRNVDGDLDGYLLTLKGDGDAYANLEVAYDYTRGSGGKITEK